MSARLRQSGFTLVELMFVVVLVSVLAGALAPSVRRTLMEQKLATAARDLVRIIRDAKQKAATSRLAHLVHVDPGAGEVRVLRGINSSCAAQNWLARNAFCNDSEVRRRMGVECLVASMDNVSYALSDTTSIRLREWVGDQAESVARSICFAPNGLTYTARKAIGEEALTLPKDDLGGGFLFEVQMRLLGASAEEQDLVPPIPVLVPTNGSPRVVR